MTTTNEIFTSQGSPVVMGGLLKTDVLGRIRVDPAQRETILDAFEACSMTGSAFARHHGIKIQTFASWIQQRRRARGDYQNEAVCRKLRMRKEPPAARLQDALRSPTSMNLIEVDLTKNLPNTPLTQPLTQPPTQPPTQPLTQPLEVLLACGAVVRVSSENQLPLLKILLRELPC